MREELEKAEIEQTLFEMRKEWTIVDLKSTRELYIIGTDKQEWYEHWVEQWNEKFKEWTERFGYDEKWIVHLKPPPPKFI